MQTIKHFEQLCTAILFAFLPGYTFIPVLYIDGPFINYSTYIIFTLECFIKAQLGFLPPLLCWFYWITSESWALTQASVDLKSEPKAIASDLFINFLSVC